MITKVTIKGTQAVQMFGPAQKAVADAVADWVKSGVIPKDQVRKTLSSSAAFHSLGSG